MNKKYVSGFDYGKLFLNRIVALVVILMIGLFAIGLGYIYPTYMLVKADLEQQGSVQIVEVNPPRYELQAVCFQGTSYITNGYTFKEEMSDSGFFIKCDEEE